MAIETDIGLKSRSGFRNIMISQGTASRSSAEPDTVNEAAN